MVILDRQPHSASSCYIWLGLCPNYHGKETTFSHINSFLDSSQLWPCYSHDLWKRDSYVDAIVYLYGSLWSSVYQSNLGLSIRGNSCCSTTARKHSSLANLIIFDVGSTIGIQFHASKQPISSVHIFRGLWNYWLRSCQINTKRVEQSNLQRDHW